MGDSNARRLVWLASYPKSGNTWVRLFLTAYSHPEQDDLDLNDIDVSLHAGSRELFDRIVGLEASDMTPAEIDRYRPDVYRQLAIEGDEPLFLKVHDCWRRNAEGVSVFPPETTAAVILIVRDPRGVAPSFANHFNLSNDQAIGQMASPDFALAAHSYKLAAQLPQPVGSWSSHAASWLDQTELSVVLVRYEDLHAAPERHFARIVQAAGLPLDTERLQRALACTRFDRLQAQEDATGFRERRIGTPRFFRRGKAASWREELTPAQIERIVACHGPTMVRLGYLDNRKGIVHE